MCVVCVCVSVGYVHVSASAQEGQKRAPESLWSWSLR